MIREEIREKAGARPGRTLLFNPGCRLNHRGKQTQPGSHPQRSLLIDLRWDLGTRMSLGSPR